MGFRKIACPKKIGEYKMANLFENNTLIVNQKFTVIANQYQIQDENGNEIGFVQENMSTGKKALSLLVSKKIMPFNLSILDAQKNVLATISRGERRLPKSTRSSRCSNQSLKSWTYRAS